GDLPARSGMGSSASFTVGLLHALHALRGEMVSKRQLAREAIEVDQDIVGDKCGTQDQVAAAFGGFSKIEFREHRAAFEVQPVTITPQVEERLLDRLMLFYTGMARTASDVAEVQIANMEHKRGEMADLVALVDEGWNALAAGDICALGPLLHESWMIKRSLSPVISNDFIDSIYERARKIGATGGKLLGAGSGGAFLIFSEPELACRAVEEFKDLVYIPFSIDRAGSQVVYYQGEQ
ncbi:MAG: kinase, partial [Dehalococcoidia bacterium]|nr:kinase [Dehalococcoidia bacterium]